MSKIIASNRYNLKEAVKLPLDEREEEWIANNIFDFHKQICMLFNTIDQYCTRESCPSMKVVNLDKNVNYEYLWSDKAGNQIKELSASQHINHVLDWVQEQLDNEDIFPTKSFDVGHGNARDFPTNFKEDVCKTICKRLFRVYAHVYHHHLQQVRDLKEEPHFNTSLKHYIYFVQEFKLVSDKELRPLNEFVEIHTKHPSATFESKDINR